MIRVATDDDVAAVARLEGVCLGANAWSPALVAEGIGKRLPTVSYLVGTSDDGSEEVVGYAVASLAGDDVETVVDVRDGTATIDVQNASRQQPAVVGRASRVAS